MPPFILLLVSGISTKQGWLAAPSNLEVRYVSCNESAKKRCLSSELEETVFSLTHELFMTQQSEKKIQLRNLVSMQF